MRRRSVTLICAPAAAALLGGCAGPGATGARATTQRFYAAVAARDGRGACAELSRTTLEAVEEEARKPCAGAILEAKLAPAGIEHVEVAETAAAVELEGGRYAFLDRSSGRWEISAAGCQPGPEDIPYDCQVEG